MVKWQNLSINLNVRSLSESATLRINELSNKLINEGKHIYKMGLGQSPFPVPDYIVEALKLHASKKEYLPVKGLRELREAVAYFHTTKDKIEARAENVLIGPGSKELMFLLQLVYYGDLIIPTPCWVSYTPQAKIIGKQIKLIPTSREDKWQLTPNKLESFLKSEQDKFKPRLLVLNYPANPHGGSYTEQYLKKIANIARRYRMLILSDEIYGQLQYDGNHISIGRFYPEGTIISSGLSKWCGAGGWRLGTFTFPGELSHLMNEMAVVASETYTSVCAPIQYAAVSAFKNGASIDRYLWHVRRILSSLCNKTIEILTQSGIEVNPPIGSFYLFIDFSPFKEKLSRKKIKTSNELCAKLLEDTGVAILPGSAFERPEEELTARLAFVNFDGASALAASERIPLDTKLPDDFPGRWCGDVLEGIRKIADWIRS